MDDTRLRNFIDKDGRVKQWPAKRALQIAIIGYVANHFKDGSTYSEKEINEEIKKLHTFGDWALVRRELCELGYFDRDVNGMVYTRTLKD